MRVWALSHQAHKHMKSSWYYEYDNTHIFHWSLLAIKQTLVQDRLVLLDIFDNLINRRTITFPIWTRTHKHVFTLCKPQADSPTPHATVRCATIAVRTPMVSWWSQATWAHLLWAISKSLYIPTAVAHKKRTCIYCLIATRILTNSSYKLCYFIQILTGLPH